MRNCLLEDVVTYRLSCDLSFSLGSVGTHFLLLLCSFCFVLSGCSGEGESAPPITFSIESVPGDVSYGDIPENTLYELNDPVSGMASLHGVVHVAAGNTLFQVGASGLIPVDVYWEGGEPSDTGMIYAMAARADSVLIAAENGIFHTYQWAVLQSPLSDVFQGPEIRQMAVRGEGEEEEIFVGTQDGLFRLTPTSFEEIVFDEALAGPSALAALDDVVLVAYGAMLYELNTLDWTYFMAPDFLGTVNHISGQGSTAVLACSEGLGVRAAAQDYQLYNGSLTPPSLAAIDGAGRPIGLAQDGLLRVSEGALTGLVPFSEGTEGAHMAVDTFNNIWVGADHLLTGWAVGEPLLFSATVGPLFSAKCNFCHLSGSGGPKHDFSQYEEVMAIQDTIFERVSLRQMPLGVPLLDDELQMVLDWYQSGVNP
jgi:hypothetical protein